MRILMFVSNDVVHDPRVLKEARALIAAGHDVTAIGWDRAGSLPGTEERAGLEIHRVRTSGSMRLLWKDLFRNPVWWRRAVHIARGLPFDAIHCHDLDTLPIGDRLKELTGRPLVYDAHEVFGYMIEADVPKVVVDYT
ncbi:MAG TPA: glycosyltransferase, partial [Thermoplasmata archaeon]|nr:glycosyltransferase [Thermoplasmata archaeon]